MSKKFKIVLDLFLIMMICLPVLSYFNSAFSNQWNWNDIFDRKDALDELNDESISVLIMGSSGLYAGVNPNVLWHDYDILSYNFSTSGFYPFPRFYMFQNIIKNKKIDLLVTDISSLRIEELKEESIKRFFYTLDTVEEKESFLNDFAVQYKEDINKKEYYFPFITQHSEWYSLNGARKNNYVDKYKMGSLLNCEVEKIGIEYIDDSYIDEINYIYLKKMIDLALENGIEVMLVQTPRGNRDRDLYEFSKKEFEKAGVKVFDYSSQEQFEKMGLNLQEDFYNIGHLNIWGSEKFTKQLGKDIIKNYPDVKIWQESDLDYTEKTKPWVEAYEKYENFLTELESNNEE